MKRAPSRGRRSGFSLIELMVALAIVAILTVMATPTFSDLIDRYRLKGAAEALLSEIQFARTESIRRNQAVYVAFGTTTASCYGIGTNAACTCDNCDIRTSSVTQFGTDFPGIEIASVLAAGAATDRFGFSPRQGTLDTAGEVAATFRSKKTARQLTVTTGMLGIARICSPGATVVGYPAC